MPNHFHLLVQAEKGKNISKCLQWLCSIFARTYNNRYGEYGSVWQSRFYSKEIKDGMHLGTAWRYVEQNPVRAKLVKSPEQCRWSSAYLRSKEYKPNFLIEPKWWGSDLMKEWWSTELLDQKLLDKVRRSIRSPHSYCKNIIWGSQAELYQAAMI